MTTDDEIGPSEEYESLRQELLESKRYVFERPLLIAAAGTGALVAFRDFYAAAVPLLMAGLLLFNLWFTVNRLYSAGRIVAYIQLQLEERRLRPWRGWESCLREYRKWIKRPGASVTVDGALDWDAVPDALLYYPAIYQLHIGIVLLAFVSASLLVLRSPSPESAACAAGTALLTVWFAVSAIHYRPSKLRTTIERNRVIWKHVLDEMRIKPGEWKEDASIMEDTPQRPDPDSVRMAMDHAWRDHHHARDQTWKALQMVAVLGAGLVTVDAEFENPIYTLTAGLLVVLGASFGLSVTHRHRGLEIRKFVHIMNCEQWLGLHRDDLIPEDDGKLGSKPQRVRDGAVRLPRPFSLLDIANPRVHNTALFIARTHAAIALFAVLVIIMRAITSLSR